MHVNYHMCLYFCFASPPPRDCIFCVSRAHVPPTKKRKKSRQIKLRFARAVKRRGYFLRCSFIPCLLLVSPILSYGAKPVTVPSPPPSFFLLRSSVAHNCCCFTERKRRRGGEWSPQKEQQGDPPRMEHLINYFKTHF